MSNLDLLSDHSKEKLVTMPRNILDMVNLKMLFLEGNFLTKLPDDIFWKLPKLSWLDLRNNLLESFPTSVAFHEKLENLLLSNNSLERLPNELGTVANLKALQVTENPLVYPERKVIMQGTNAIKSFLKMQYDKVAKHDDDISDKIFELDENSLIEEQSEDRFLQKSVQVTVMYPNTPKSIENVTHPDQKELRIEKLKTKISDEQCVNPDLEVKKLLTPGSNKKEEQESIKITHKVSTVGNKIRLKSSCNKSTPRIESSGDDKFNNLKDGWLNELRILLSDQERILQQERNLKAISNWREKRKNEPIREFNGDLPKPPYDIDPKYNRMLTREELARTLDEFKQRGFTRTADSSMTTPIELQRMIKHIMDELKEMELQCESTNNHVEMDLAEKQIRTMMEIQKKLMSLKSLNDATL